MGEKASLGMYSWKSRFQSLQQERRSDSFSPRLNKFTGKQVFFQYDYHSKTQNRKITLCTSLTG